MGMQAIIQATAGGRSLLDQTPAAGSIPYGASGTTYGTLSPGTSGQSLVTTGAAAPIFAWANQTNAAYNGGFDILQRQLGSESTETSYSDDTYAFDRWVILTQTASVQCSRQTGDTRSRYCGRIKQNQASAQRAGMVQILDADTSYRFRSQTVRVPARVKCSSNQAIRIALLEWTGTADSPTSDVVNDWTSSTYTTGNFFISTTTTVVATATVTPSAATWTDLALTGTVSASCNNLIVVIWSEGTMAQNVTLDVTEVGIYHGAEGRLWVPPNVQDELRRCQHFYRRDMQTHLESTLFIKTSTTRFRMFSTLPAVPMRTAPTAANSTPTYLNAAPGATQVAFFNMSTAGYVTISGAITSSASVTSATFSLILDAGTAFGGSTGNLARIEVGTSVWFDYSAEL